MDTNLIFELIGYFASVLVAISLMMSKIVRLRIINTFGAATFIVYGLLIGSIPVAVMNVFIVLINAYYLRKMYATKEYFKLLKVLPTDDYLKAFITYYNKPMQEFQPDSIEQLEHCNLFIFIHRDMVPAGLFAGKLDEAGVLTLHLDFVTPRFRDFKTGDFLFHENRNFFIQNGVKRIRTKGSSSNHINYLKKMQFREESDDSNWFYLELE